MKLGKAFLDNVISEQKKQSRLSSHQYPSWWLGHGRALFFATVLLTFASVLIFRLFYLTVISGHEMRLLSDGNRTRELIRHAPRGILLDRTGKPLTANAPQYRLVKPCEDLKNQTGCVVYLSESEGESFVKRGLPAGTYIEVDYSRNYLYPTALAHVLGFTGELSQTELQDPYFTLRNYRPGDKVGRSGAEEVFEEKLHGRDGRELVEINAAGKAVRTLGRDSEIPGENITLSLDAGLSQAAAVAFPTGERGAVVVTRPDTGEILALYSSPSYDPNHFSLGMSQTEYEGLMTNPDQSLFDRVIGGVYPPGSTFKIVVALAGLEEGSIEPDTQVLDSGVLTIGPFSFPNWYFAQYGKTEGAVNLVKALQRSNDIFFYKVGEWLGVTKIDAWARKVGIGKPLGIEFSGEAGGLVPDPAWKETHFSSAADREARNNLWYLGDTYHLSIGQGYLLTTPLQVNEWTNVIANGGKLCKPTIKKVTSDKRQVTSGCQDLKIKPETIKLITEGMKAACETGGTGWPLFDFKVAKAISDKQQVTSSTGNEASNSSTNNLQLTTYNYIPVACKTGTAEFGDPKNRTHAWFTAFAPIPTEFMQGSRPGYQGETLSRDKTISGDPEISVTVLVEGGGEGSNVAAPIAKKILEYWFSR